MGTDNGKSHAKRSRSSHRKFNADRGLSPQALADFETALREVDQALRQLKQRYVQVRRSQVQYAQLIDKVEQPDLPQAELGEIAQQINQLEVTLESQLFRWRQLQEPFWQVVRFSGLGFILGWLLKSCAS